MWPFRKQLIEPLEPSILEFLLDTRLESAPHLYSHLEGGNVSDEVMELEVEEADYRFDEVSHLTSAITAWSEVLSGLIAMHFPPGDEQNNITDTQRAAFRQMLHTVSVATTIGSISQFLQHGILAHGNISRRYKK